MTASAERYRFSRLDNGVRVVSIDVPHVATASLGIWVDVGARHEPVERNGVAHLLEHMAFKGTRRRSAQGIAEEIENVGGQLNAYTSREHTAFHARVLAEDVPLAMDLLADIVRNARIDEEELARERTVVLQEIGQVLDTPDDWVFDLWQDTAYPDQPLGRSILGPAETVERLQRADVLDHLRTHYAPERLVVAAAGRVDHERLTDLARAHLGDLARRPAPPMAPGRYRGGHRLEADDAEQLHLVLGVEGVAYDDPDFYAAQVLATALGGGMSSRLFQEVREKRGLAYNVFAFAASYVDTGLFGMYAAAAPADAAELLTVLEATSRALVARPDAGEIARARAQLKASLLMGLESSTAVCEDLARQHLIFGDYLAPEAIAARIDAVDAAALARVGERLLARPRASLCALGPVTPELERAAGYALAA
jgi:predicted Zn-dependent peptidase